jgi:hypothetical protein
MSIVDGILDGKRKRVSTTVNVNGERVKRLNMYSLEGGEPSVWDAELGNHEDDEDEPEVLAPTKPGRTKSTVKRELDPL